MAGRCLGDQAAWWAPIYKWVYELATHVIAAKRFHVQ